ncbi:putative ankyrin repeat protein [Cotonvirus japonicus]|uniref:Ankyrin repeat protein n=1 Tax=Cotonvirus japonicus TaxID=2811091 RepID=A0ABM7NQR9_9VIRU|nr:putative ankyrin repeat protein [Cotonvirus japonicus]BCS82501.1 putative ankyrin repeat protein [Cotonvirus japonicus]
MTCINEPIPYELWIHIANFSKICNYNLFFTNKKFFSLINESKFDFNVIEYAIYQGNLDVLKHVLSLKYSRNSLVNDEKFTSIGIQKCLTISCEQGHYDIVKFLVNNGVDVQINDNCAIKWASQNGYLEIVKLLVEKGADIQAGNNYALRLASFGGHLEIVKYLVEKGADIQACGKCAIIYASECNHQNVIKFLIEKGVQK